MGKVPKLIVPEDKRKDKRKLAFVKGDIVYFTAYLKKNPSAFYMCRGQVERLPEEGVRRYYKVKVIAIGDRSVGGRPVVEQTTLLGMILSKRGKEISKILAPFMEPPDWIEKSL